MSAEVLIGAAVGVFFISNRARSMYLRVRNQKRAQRFERSLHEARDAMTTTTSPYRATTGADRDLVTLLGIASLPYEDRLRACGFTLLGDIVFAPRATPSAISRVMVDEVGTSCAYILIATADPMRAQHSLSSYTPDEMFSTRALRAPLAEPPSAHRQLIEKGLTIDARVAKHRAFAPLADPHKTLVRITSLDTLLVVLQRVHERNVAWRDAQPPEELLDADLRAALGEHYELVGKAWARRIRGRLPQATLRRSS